MAEIVDLRNEESIPELESMLTHLFKNEEVKAIINLRNELNYKMNRTPKNKDDCYKFIENELKLLRIIKLRHKKKGLEHKIASITNLESAVKDRINKLFAQCIRWFSYDIRVWMTYVRFCQHNRSPGDTGRVLAQMLKQHGHTEPQLFKIAADWELNKCKCIDRARAHLTNGIHLHKDNKNLLTELFKLELLDAEMKRKACIVNNIQIDTSNPHLTAQKAECIYEVSIKKLKDVELLNNLMNICEEFDFASALLAKIYQELCLNDDNERMWDIIATRELKTDEKLSPKVKIGKAITLYETAVKRVNTTTMWSYYLDALLELHKDETVLPNFKRKLLMTVFKKADEAGKLTEQYYLIWVKFLQSAEKHKTLVEVLCGAVKQPHLTESVELWHTLLRAHLNHGEEKQAMQVFEQGIVDLGKLSLPIWKLMLQFEHTKRNNKVDEMYKKSWNAPPEICREMQPMHLEWVTLTHGIASTRKMYEAMLNHNNVCLEVHRKMIELELIQPTLVVKRVRTYHSIACAQYGSSRVDVWIDQVKFESTKGDKEKVVEVYWRARNNLEPHLMETFLYEFSLIHTIPTSTTPDE